MRFRENFLGIADFSLASAEANEKSAFSNEFSGFLVVFPEKSRQIRIPNEIPGKLMRNRRLLISFLET
jgi:hypothetical protein